MLLQAVDGPDKCFFVSLDVQKGRVPENVIRNNGTEWDLDQLQIIVGDGAGRSIGQLTQIIRQDKIAGTIDLALPDIRQTRTHEQNSSRFRSREG